MQSRATNRLAKRLRQNHENTKSWAVTAQEMNILTADGKPDKALAYRIAVCDYEPSRPETRLRLGLSRKAPTHRPQPIHEWPDFRLLWALEHREEM
jgi:hypothetical protein